MFVFRLFLKVTKIEISIRVFHLVCQFGHFKSLLIRVYNATADRDLLVPYQARSFCLTIRSSCNSLLSTTLQSPGWLRTFRAYYMEKWIGRRTANTYIWNGEMSNSRKSNQVEFTFRLFIIHGYTTQISWGPKIFCLIFWPYLWQNWYVFTIIRLN